MPRIFAISAAGEAAVVVQDDHGPLVGLKSAESPLQLVPIGNRTRVVADGWLERERSHLQRPAPQLPTLVGTGVDQQAMEPGVEPIRIAQRGKLTPRANERFLDRVLRQVRRPKDQASDRIQAIAGGCRKDFECLVISAGVPLRRDRASYPLSIFSTAWVTALSSMTDVGVRSTQSSGQEGPGAARSGQERRPPVSLT